jgi:hypothetical protein
MILSAAADLFVASYNFITLKPMEMVEIVAAFLACVVLAIFRIKTKAVNVERLLEAKRAVAEEAANA